MAQQNSNNHFCHEPNRAVWNARSYWRQDNKNYGNFLVQELQCGICSVILTAVDPSAVLPAEHTPQPGAGSSIVCWLNRKAEGPPQPHGEGEAADVDLLSASQDIMQCQLHRRQLQPPQSSTSSSTSNNSVLRINNPNIQWTCQSERQGGRWWMSLSEIRPQNQKLPWLTGWVSVGLRETQSSQVNTKRHYKEITKSMN